MCILGKRYSGIKKLSRPRIMCFKKSGTQMKGRVSSPESAKAIIAWSYVFRFLNQKI